MVNMDVSDKVAAVIKHPLFKDEFLDFFQVILMGAKKYAADGWLDADGNGTSRKEQQASIVRHVAQYYCHLDYDEESRLHHGLHIATRGLMMYTRAKREIIHTSEYAEGFEQLINNQENNQ